MNVIIPHILNIAKEHNMDIYLVGGALRDIILNREVKDYDFVIDKMNGEFIEDIGKFLKKKVIILDKKRHIYRIVTDENIILDFAKLIGDNIKDDLFHRDFTINAMAYDLKSPWPIDIKKIIDPINGIKNLKEKIIKYVNKNVFTEDPIRILRAVSFMSQLDFELDLETREQIIKDAQKIKKVSGEKISMELFKILKEKKSHHYFNLMAGELKVLEHIFPHIAEMKEVGQCKYHVVDSWTHSVYTMKLVEEYIYTKDLFEDYIQKAYDRHLNDKITEDHRRYQLIKLGALLHDIGKPAAERVDEQGRTRFKGHEIVGAEIIREYAKRLKLSKKENEILYRYVKLHMWPLVLYKNNDLSAKNLYKYFKMGNKETLDILLIALADIVATRSILNPDEEMKKFKTYIEYIASNYLTRYLELEDLGEVIIGNQIMEILKLPQGKEIGKIILDIKKAIFMGEIAFEKDSIVDYITKKYKGKMDL